VLQIVNAAAGVVSLANSANISRPRYGFLHRRDHFFIRRRKPELHSAIPRACASVFPAGETDDRMSSISM
jgi:hypothetical protein